MEEINIKVTMVRNIFTTLKYLFCFFLEDRRVEKEALPKSDQIRCMSFIGTDLKEWKDTGKNGLWFIEMQSGVECNDLRVVPLHVIVLEMFQCLCHTPSGAFYVTNAPITWGYSSPFRKCCFCLSNYNLNFRGKKTKNDQCKLKTFF